MAKKLLITGASGFLGRQIVPRLIARGYSLVIVGRSPEKLRSQFRGVDCCSYDLIAQLGIGCDAVLHLAVLNNDANATWEDFEKANLHLLENVLGSAKSAGIPLFVNLTTFHAFSQDQSQYAKSKRKALEFLSLAVGIKVVNLFLPAVYGDEYAGRLSILNRFPASIRGAALTCLSSTVATVHIDKLVDFLTSDLSSAPQTVMLANNQDNNPIYRIGRRLIDWAFCAAIIVFAGWLLVLIWIAVRLDSSGPGLFAQDRMGKDQKVFVCYKFRTMKTGTIQAGTHEVAATAITGIGGFLRRTKIDELPQIWNILRGEISLVGPRPGLPVQAMLTQARARHGVFDVLPGITGLAQINSIDMSDPERLAEMDARYIAQRGLLADMKIIIATLLGRGQGDKVAT